MPASTRSTSAVSASIAVDRRCRERLPERGSRSCSTYTSNPGSPASVMRVTIAAPPANLGAIARARPSSALSPHQAAHDTRRVRTDDGNLRERVGDVAELDVFAEKMN